MRIYGTYNFWVNKLEVLLISAVTTLLILGADLSIETFIKLKLSIFRRPEIDPFQASESDITDMYEPDQLIDSDKEKYKDEDVEISILF